MFPKNLEKKSILNNIGQDIDLHNYGKQRNIVLNPNKKEKNRFLNFLSTENDRKPSSETY